MTPDDLLRAMLDPTAPVPAGWPSGALGAFMFFVFPVGGGIPTGVLRANAEGVPLPVIALLFFASDVMAAFLNEPLVLFFTFLGTQIPLLGRIGQWFTRATLQTGLQDEGARGPLGLILLSFTASLLTGRAAAKAAGHGFVSGWSLAIAGDMLYFLLLMVSTLFLSSILGDERMTVGIVLVAMFVLPTILRRVRARRLSRPTPVLVAASPLPSVALRAAEPVRVAQTPRKQRTRRRARRR